MVCCLNPECVQPINPDDRQQCQDCGSRLIPLLRHRYRVLKPLGSGAFGKTYIAEDRDKLNIPCVVKQLLPSKAHDHKIKALFEREAQVLQQVSSHPQIPGLLDFWFFRSKYG